MATRNIGRCLELQPAAKKRIAEIFVADEGDGGKAMAGAAIYVVGDDALVESGVFGICEIDGGVEVALALQVVTNVSRAFLQEVLVDASFGVNGKQFTKFTGAVVNSLHTHPHARATHHLHRDWNLISGGIVLAALHGHGSA